MYSNFQIFNLRFITKRSRNIIHFQCSKIFMWFELLLWDIPSHNIPWTIADPVSLGNSNWTFLYRWLLLLVEYSGCANVKTYAITKHNASELLKFIYFKFTSLWCWIHCGITVTLQGRMKHSQVGREQALLHGEAWQHKQFQNAQGLYATWSVTESEVVNTYITKATCRDNQGTGLTFVYSFDAVTGWMKLVYLRQK